MSNLILKRNTLIDNRVTLKANIFADSGGSLFGVAVVTKGSTFKSISLTTSALYSMFVRNTGVFKESLVCERSLA
jgi:hypothetical protein